MTKQEEKAVRVQITEYLVVDLGDRHWHCRVCGHDLGPAARSYKEGCLIADRDPQEVHPPIAPVRPFNFSFDPEWVRLLEFYCPDCATLLETEYLPPGHPLTWDIDLDLDTLAERHGGAAKSTPKTAPAGKGRAA